MDRARLKSAAFAAGLLVAACTSSDGATNADGGAIDAEAGSSETGSPDAATAEASPDAPADPCGPIETTWSRCAGDPLARAGSKQNDGRYELSIGDPDVQYDAPAATWRAWWSAGLGATYTDPKVQLGIKYAQSADGVAWTPLAPFALLSRPGTADWDAVKLETPTVAIVPSNPPDRRYVLFYSGSSIDKPVNGSNVAWYQLGLAFSADGKTFTRLPATESPYAGKPTPYGNIEGLVLLGRDAFPGVANVADGLVADPEIVVDAGTFHLFYSSAAVDGAGTAVAFGIGHATSSDGVHFTPQPPIAALAGGRGPSVVRGPSGWEMFFQKDSAADTATVPSTFNPQLGVWRATSGDLVSWTVGGTARDLTWDGAIASEKYGWISAGDMVFANGEHRYYYSAFADLAPPAPDWVVPLQGGQYAPALIVLDMARRR
jgi:hypothetical protein